MDLSDEERSLVLAALFELSMTRAEGDAKRDEIKRLVLKLGGDPEAMVFGVAAPAAGPEGIDDLPGLDDEPDGIYYPHATNEGDEALAALLADCVANGRHHLATLDHPAEGMVIGCSHCHRYWRMHS